MNILIIISSIILYLIIGRIIMKLLAKYNMYISLDPDYYDDEYWISIGAIFFPLILIWVGIVWISDLIV